MATSSTPAAASGSLSRRCTRSRSSASDPVSAPSSTRTVANPATSTTRGRVAVRSSTVPAATGVPSTTTSTAVASTTTRAATASARAQPAQRVVGGLDRPHGGGVDAVAGQDLRGGADLLGGGAGAHLLDLAQPALVRPGGLGVGAAGVLGALAGLGQGPFQRGRRDAGGVVAVGG